ncbi:hypothetical protein M422DRAFT_265728 [Sphaerobolus stellatus SS14]|uniref:Unplaced genomic scaffold SPHSTscaffold_152, whole genome shotgun sequence n=1 Tax=Sphaerobolus stellatus (strain SS14) TaxID=990650 RepID=A0A0C9UT62_SPHS4|nr:hypothetical protein M422DRAFT_265728 [Sphaerobolus stellatus SS14]
MRMRNNLEQRFTVTLFKNRPAKTDADWLVVFTIKAPILLVSARGVVFGVKNAIPAALCSQIQAEVPGSVHFSDKDGDFIILYRQKYTKSAEELKKAKTYAALVSVSEGSPAVTPRVIIRKNDGRYTYPSSEGRRSADSSNTTSQQSERLFLEHYHIDAHLDTLQIVHLLSLILQRLTMTIWSLLLILFTPPSLQVKSLLRSFRCLRMVGGSS